ncbi:DUF4245 family protein [Nocardioides cheoyonin]|uniref:DUF4245 family protein n=1 Tax=Nocardioides cheoyonin TaxID=3156615 RepID=UPI0032B55994
MSEQGSQPGPQAGTQAGAQAGSPQGARRYPRTFGGLIGSMVVLVLAVVAYWVITTTFGDATRDLRNEGVPKSADWVGTVRTVQSAEGENGVKIKVVYPRSLPSGWYANTEPSFAPGKHPTWTMNFVRGDNQYVGIELAPGSAHELAEKNVDDGVREGGTTTVDTAVGDTWQTWSDAGGDHAYTTRLAGSTLIIWGPHDDDLRTFLGLLTTDRLKR